MNELYCDGGVVEINPSPYGGTWAARLVEDGQVKHMQGGIITPAQAQMPTISNNLTEMLALVRGLAMLPADWCGTVFSDSNCTLGRAFRGSTWNGIPTWLYDDFGKQTKRLIHWGKFTYVLLSGHPTKAQLAAGIGKKGRPVSEHNVWCDQMCQILASRPEIKKP